MRAVPLIGSGHDPLAHVHRLSDGRYVGGASWSTSQIINETADGLYRPATAIYTFGPDGTVEDTIAACAVRT